MAAAYRRAGVGIHALHSGKEFSRIPVGQMDEGHLNFDRTGGCLFVADGEKFYRAIDLKQLIAALKLCGLSWGRSPAKAWSLRLKRLRMND